MASINAVPDAVQDTIARFGTTVDTRLHPSKSRSVFSSLRTSSRHSQPGVQESLNARSEYITSQDDGVAEHRINQYIIKQEIGRGSFGAVHLAIDQYGHEYVCIIGRVSSMAG